jgi:hypothetical protein
MALIPSLLVIIPFPEGPARGCLLDIQKTPKHILEWFRNVVNPSVVTQKDVLCHNILVPGKHLRGQEQDIVDDAIDLIYDSRQDELLYHSVELCDPQGIMAIPSPYVVKRVIVLKGP